MAHMMSISGSGNTRNTALLYLVRMEYCRIQPNTPLNKATYVHRPSTPDYYAKEYYTDFTTTYNAAPAIYILATLLYSGLEGPSHGPPIHPNTTTTSSHDVCGGPD